MATVYVDLGDHPFAYPEAPRAILAVKLVRAARGHAGDRLWLSRGFWRAVEIVGRASISLWAIVRCDLFIVGSGRTLLGVAELRALRLLRKRIVVVFFGSDARPAYLDGVDANRSDATANELIAQTREKRRIIRRSEKYADVIVSHGPYSQLLRREYADWIQIGIPTLMHDSTPPSTGSSVRILHAPSDSLAKGTSLIRETVARLREEGLEIDYREVQGASNAVVRTSISEADIVVDQLYADTPMAVLASEAAAAGKPAVVGSLDWPSIIADIERDALPPSIRSAPEMLGDVLRELIESPEARESAGRQARSFVRSRWSPEAVARRYLALADGSAPREWFKSPASIRYVGGSGLSRDRLRRVLKAIGGHGGEAFSVSDKAGLEGRLSAAEVE